MPHRWFLPGFLAFQFSTSEASSEWESLARTLEENGHFRPEMPMRLATPCGLLYIDIVDVSIRQDCGGEYFEIQGDIAPAG